MVNPVQQATKSALWDISEWDEAEWSSDDQLLDRLLARIETEDKKSRRTKARAGQQRDALIAETAIKNGLGSGPGD